MQKGNQLKAKVAELPAAPGIYMFKDSGGEVIYIGKAKSLKKRVQSYFSRALDSKSQAMVSKIFDIEYRPTATESQAQILESSLIKERQPQYNIDLKDDKSFPWVRITAEEFPVVSIYRRKGKQAADRALYFGPYTNVKLLRQAMKVIRRIFGFRSCRNMPDEACLYYRLKLCPAPCIKQISAWQYRKVIERIRMFLESRYADLMYRLSRDMQEAAEDKRFEEAAELRDQIRALSAFSFGPAYPAGGRGLEELGQALKLEKPPLRIEAFDISNISGKQATGSLVSFFKGLPDKNNYRRFRIKSVARIDDYDMLREVVRRRYARLIREHAALPDLILIDGGKGHLAAAAGEIAKQGLKVPLFSIAKDKENIYAYNRAGALRFKEGSAALNLIRRIRDEAHRFAISYHHVLQRKKIIGR